MKLSDMDFIRLLPDFMKQDGANIGLSKGIDSVTEELSERIGLLTTWDQLDNMSDAELDMLAEELHISWYDKTADISIKRTIIRESDMVHAKLGTNWAVMQVVRTYFGEGRIVEWFDYGGMPYHFRIATTNKDVVNKKFELFRHALYAVKRESACLEALEIDVSDGMNCYFGAAGRKIKEAEADVDARIRKLPLYMGIASMITRMEEGDADCSGIFDMKIGSCPLYVGVLSRRIKVWEGDVDCAIFID